MKNSFFSMFYSLMLLFSVIVGLSVNSLFNVWLALEFNMMIFLCLLMLSSNHIWETSFKYFLVQSSASALFLTTVFIFWSEFSSNISLCLASLTLLLKLGAAPFHFWFIDILPEVTWNLFFLLSTIQKILPLYLFEQIMEQTSFIWVIMGLMFGVAGGLSNLKMKKILGYSSIFTLAWALAAKNFSLGVGFIFIYAVALAFLTYKMNWSVSDKINSMLEVSHYSSTMTVLLALLSMAGIPPLVGFVAKLLVLQELVKLGEFGLILALTQTSVLFVFIYLKLFLTSVTWGKNLTILSQFSKLVELLGPMLLSSGVLLFLLLHNKCLCMKNFEFLGL